MKVIIDIDEDELLMFKAAMEVGYGNSAMEHILSGEIVDPANDKSTSEILNDIRKEIQYEADNVTEISLMDAYHHCLQIIDNHIQHKEEEDD